MTDLKIQIATALADFNTCPLKQPALNLLDTLGYRSDKTLDVANLINLCEFGHAFFVLNRS